MYFWQVFEGGGIKLSKLKNFQFYNNLYNNVNLPAIILYDILISLSYLKYKFNIHTKLSLYVWQLRAEHLKFKCKTKQVFS